MLALTFAISFLNRMKNRGPRIEPYGTPKNFFTLRFESVDAYKLFTF